MSIQQMLLSASGASGYLMDKSLRFRASASAYLNRTPASAGNQTTWTWSGWVKRGTLGAVQEIFSAGLVSPDKRFELYFLANDTLSLSTNAGFGSPDGDVAKQITTSQVFRDPSAWYHIVAAVDTTQATAANRLKLYVNGAQVTALASSSYPSQNHVTAVNGTFVHYHSRWVGPTLYYYDGYLAEVNLIDGQALTPASFGDTNALTGVWQPKAYTGTYGTNGFYLDFETTTSVAALGTDKSGNGNTWTVNNISLTAGVTYDSMTDVPTLTNATTANYAVLNPLYQPSGSGAVSFGSGNLLIGPVASSQRDNCGASMLMSSTGYWYAEFTGSGASSGNNNMIGIVGESDLGLMTSSNFVGVTANSYGYLDQGNLRNNNITSQTVSTMGTTPVVMVAFGNGKLWWGLNGTWLGTGSPNPSTATSPAYSGLTGNYGFAISTYNTSGGLIWHANFGQRPFAYTPPTGFVALNTFNLPTATILKGNTVMDATTYTGTAAAQTIANAAAFYPDLVWGKQRSGVNNNIWVDSNRGATNFLVSNTNDAEATNSAVVSAIGSSGFTLGTDGTINGSGQTNVAWQWNAGSGSTSSNTSGTITSTVSVNATAGFSIAKFTTQASGVGTFGHGLGVAPAFYMVTSRSAVSGRNIYHKSIGATQYLQINTTAAAATDSSLWNNTAPTSSLITIGTAFAGGSTAICYAWSEIDGFSKFGSYTGNGSADGSFIYTGFRPRWVMIKRTDSTSNWFIHDTTRDPYNLSQSNLYAESSSAEDTLAAGNMDFVSNGFKSRTGGGSNPNVSGGTYIYAAFAEVPFKHSLAR